MSDSAKIAVVIPGYRVRDRILDVLRHIGPEVSKIYVVDDCCPEGTGSWVARECTDPRVRVIQHERNQGVGGATITGYRAAYKEGADVVVKIDGDGQMDPSLISYFIEPILNGQADYTKGNRFFNPEDVRTMPGLRLLGNATLSFLSKLSAGYWNIFDPTNGYTAVHGKIIGALPLEKISQRYFFETDLLFRLNTLRCVVRDVPMPAVYGGEPSSLRIRTALRTFLWGNLRNFAKRVVYNYYLRDFSLASMEVVIGSIALAWGLVFGLWKWIVLASVGEFASAGTVMLSVLPIIVGVQLVLSALNYDVQNVPRVVIHPTIPDTRCSKS